MLCPSCGQQDSVRLHRTKILDGIVTLARLRPWRCLRCRRRYYAREIAWELMRYAHCPKCGSLSLDQTADLRASGRMRSVLQLRHSFAYRCAACDLAFHSSKPLRDLTMRQTQPAADELASR